MIAVLASLTLLPAVFSLLGDKINRLSLPILGLRGQPDEEQAAGFWDRVSRGVMRRPVLSLVLGVGLLVAVSLPLLDMTTGIADVGTFPDEIESKQGFVIISQEFPDLLTNRVRVVIEGSIDDPAVQEAIADLRDRMESDGNFGSTALEVNGARDLAVVSAAVTGGDAASRAAITSVSASGGLSSLAPSTPLPLSASWWPAIPPSGSTSSRWSETMLPSYSLWFSA